MESNTESPPSLNAFSSPEQKTQMSNVEWEKDTGLANHLFFSFPGRYPVEQGRQLSLLPLNAPHGQEAAAELRAIL